MMDVETYEHVGVKVRILPRNKTSTRVRRPDVD